MTAWQKQIRDQRAAEDADADLFGRWWEKLDRSLPNSIIRAIDQATATTIIEKYEWLGTMPAIVLYCYGIYFGGSLGGAVVYCADYVENLGSWDRYGYTGKIICLARGACAHWTPNGSASRLIRRSMDLLPARYEVVTATVDAEAGEIGTIYQACGFFFVGQMSEGGRRTSVQLNGKTIGCRQAGRLFGSRGANILKAKGIAGVSSHPRKQRYFAFRGSHKVKREHKQAIADKIKPYPKREECANGLV